MLSSEAQVQLLAGAMVEAQVDVVGMGAFGAGRVALEVVMILQQHGYELEIREKEISHDQDNLPVPA